MDSLINDLEENRKINKTIKGIFIYFLFWSCAALLLCLLYIHKFLTNFVVKIEYPLRIKIRDLQEDSIKLLKNHKKVLAENIEYRKNEFHYERFLEAYKKDEKKYINQIKKLKDRIQDLILEKQALSKRLDSILKNNNKSPSNKNHNNISNLMEQLDKKDFKIRKLENDLYQIHETFEKCAEKYNVNLSKFKSKFGNNDNAISDLSDDDYDNINILLQSISYAISSVFHIILISVIISYINSAEKKISDILNKIENKTFLQNNELENLNKEQIIIKGLSLFFNFYLLIYIGITLFYDIKRILSLKEKSESIYIFFILNLFGLCLVLWALIISFKLKKTLMIP